MRSPRTLRTAVLAAFATLLAVPGIANAETTADTRGRDDAELVLLTEEAPVLDAGDQVWIALKWTTEGGPVSNVKVYAVGQDDLPIAYPETTGTYASPWNGPNLVDGERDFTAFRIDVPEEVKGFKLKIVATYESGGERKKDSWGFKVPVQRYERVEDLVFENPELTLGDGAGWIDLQFTGVAPSLRRWQLMIPNPDRAYIEYPQRDFSSLSRDNQLRRGETDTAGFYLDISYLGAGTHTLELSAIYLRGERTITTPFTVTITVP